MPARSDALAAYCSGVNAAATLRALPVEFQLLRLGFEPWRPADTLTVTKLLAFGLSTNWERELLRADLVRELGPELAARLDPTYPEGNPVALTPGEPWRGDGAGMVAQIDAVRELLGFAPEATGSNNWAVAPSRSATGGALLAGDPHLSPSMPGITYQLGLEVGERFCRGASFPGRLGIAFGQNNDVAWSLTNVIADTMDVFVERIDGDSLRVRRRVAPARGPRGGDRGQGPRRARAPRRFVPPTTARSSTRRSAPMTTSRWRFAGRAWTVPASPRRASGCSRPPAAPSWSPRSSLTGRRSRTWSGPTATARSATSASAASRPGAGTAPTCRSRAGAPSTSGTAGSPTRRCRSFDRSRGRLRAHREQPDRRRRLSRTTSPATGSTATGHGASRTCSPPASATDLDSLPGAPDRPALTPGARDRAAPRPPAPAAASARRRDRAPAQLGRADDPGLDRGDDLPAVHAPLRPRGRPCRDRRPRPRRALARSRRERLHDPRRRSPWRWQSHLLTLWEEADPALIGGDWDELAPRLAAWRARRPRGPLRPGSEPAGAGAGAHALHFPHALGEANPLLARIFNRTLEVGGAQETVCQIGYDPNDPFAAIWAPSWRMVADPANPERSRWQSFTGQSGTRRQPPLRRPAARAGPPARCSRWPARARGRTLTLRPR